MKWSDIIKFYKNKATNYHPSLEISNDGKYWKNLELTDSPTKTGRYIRLDDNPNGTTNPAYIRKYLRNDPIRTRGDLLPKYKLSSRDKLKIMEYLHNREKNIEDLKSKKKVSGKLTNSFIPLKRSLTNNEIISHNKKKSNNKYKKSIRK